MIMPSCDLPGLMRRWIQEVARIMRDETNRRVSMEASHVDVPENMDTTSTPEKKGDSGATDVGAAAPELGSTTGVEEHETKVAEEVSKSEVSERSR